MIITTKNNYHYEAYYANCKCKMFNKNSSIITTTFRQLMVLLSGFKSHRVFKVLIKSADENDRKYKKKNKKFYKRSQNIALPVIFLPAEVKPAFGNLILNVVLWDFHHFVIFQFCTFAPAKSVVAAKVRHFLSLNSAVYIPVVVLGCANHP